jgi:hypothetical protein
MNFLGKIQAFPQRYRMKQKGPRISLVVDHIPSVQDAFVTLTELSSTPENAS